MVYECVGLWNATHGELTILVVACLDHWRSWLYR